LVFWLALVGKYEDIRFQHLVYGVVTLLEAVDDPWGCKVCDVLEE